MNILRHNMLAWDSYVEKKNRWTIPVSKNEIENAKKGNWSIVLTPTKPVPMVWFPDIGGIRLLGLACGGGQQGPILSALGADVTIFDISERQLLQDKRLSDQLDLKIKTVQGDMRDLSIFADNYFDVVFNPCSVVFIDNVRQVWKECFRVLKPEGILMTGLINPVVYQFSETEDSFRLAYKQPYSDLYSLSLEELDVLFMNNEPLEFGHSLTDQIGGLMEEGFMVTSMYEDDWNGEKKIDKYLPSFLGIRSIKRNG